MWRRGPATSGAEVFADAACGGCHTLSAAGSTGTTGKSLDRTKLAPSAIEGFVRNGVEGMPPYASRLSDEQIALVAEYVFDSARRGGQSK